MDRPLNLLLGVPDEVPVEQFQTLLSGGSFRVERIVSKGQVSPEGFWYDQDQHEWALVVTGAARLRFEGEELVEMVAGSYVNIPAHQRHRVEWTDPSEATIWLAIYYL